MCVGWGCKVTPHQGTIFTTCLFNTRPNYSCRIFSQPLWHTVAPSQTQASDGTGGFTLRRAAKGNTPYPLAFSCAHLAPFQLPSTLHTRTFRTFPSSPLEELSSFFFFLFLSLPYPPAPPPSSSSVTCLSFLQTKNRREAALNLRLSRLDFAVKTE